MNLSHSQKKYLKKNFNKLSLEKIAEELGLTIKDILVFAKKNWPKEKYQKLIKKNKAASQGEIKTFIEIQKEFNWPNFFRKKWKVFAFLTFLVLLAYSNTLRNEFLSDDLPGIVQNKNLGNFSALFLNQPLISLRYFFYFFIYKISGFNLIPYHLLNIFFHLGSVWLVYLLLSFLTTPLIAFFTAGIFAVHPILTEAVTWISGGPYSQYGFFLLLAFWFYLLSRSRGWQLKNYLFSFLAFLPALLTTEKAVVLPLILLAFEFSFNHLKKNWRRLVPFFALSFVWIILFFALGTIKGRITSLENQYYQDFGLENPLVQIPIAIASYLGLIFWPDKLTLYHSELTFSQIQYAMMLMFSLFFLGLIGWFYRKNRQVFFWLSFFIIVLLPTLTPFKLGWVVAERYVYLASLGIFVPLAILLEKINGKIKKPQVIFIVFGVLILALSARTVWRNFDWKNQDSLWLSAGKTSPSSHQNHNNLGDLYARRGEYEKAVVEFQKAIELKPDYGDAYHNLANVYHQINQDDLALENYQKALSLNPNLWQSYQNLAAIYFSQEKLDLSKEELEKAIKINPQNTELHSNLGIVYLKLGEKEKAREEFEKALQIDPQNQKAQQQLELIR